MTDINNVPIIALEGSETWIGAWEFADQLESRFPDQDAHSFASACFYNEFGPIEARRITRLRLLRQGERDATDWIWQVQVDGHEWHVAEAGCDYTGWDCQSHLTWDPEYTIFTVPTSDED
jgi:hypothetical protein